MCGGGGCVTWHGDGVVARRQRPVGGRRWWRRVSWGVMKEVGGAHRTKYKTTTTTIIVVVVVVVPCSWSVCVACVRLWALAVVRGLWWVVVVGRGGPVWVVMGGGRRFGGFLVVFGRSSSFVVHWGRRGGKADVGRCWALCWLSPLCRWCGGGVG